MKDKIQLFEDKRIRSAWDEAKEEWLFSVSDVVEALTGSSDPRQYIKKMRNRDAELNFRWGTFCTLTALKASDGKKYRTTVSNLQGIFRIIQSIPSPKAEPIKQWLAKVGAERIDETIDPELAIERAKETYIAKGHSPEWVTQRLQGIKTRNELTDEWKKRGVEKSKDYATLTAILHKAAFDVTIKQHKEIKGLKKENLRDNMTTLEAALTMLAEASTTELERTQDPNTMSAHMDVAKAGGAVAKAARLDIEKRTGRKVVSSQNAHDLIEEKQKLDAITEN